MPILIGIETWNGAFISTAIQNAQIGLVNHGLNIYQGANTDTISSEERYDGTHFNIIGRNLAGTLLKNAVVAALGL